MKWKPWHIILLFVLWSAGSTYWYVCRIKGFCARAEAAVTTGKSVQETPEAVDENTVAPFDILSFKRNEIRVYVNDSLKWAEAREALVKMKKEGQKLIVEGAYYTDEQPPAGYDNMGQARADALKVLLKEKYPGLDIVAVPKLLGEHAPEDIAGYKDRMYWKTFTPEKVKKVQGKTIVYFDFNSTRPITDKEVLDYLKNLADELKKNPGEKVKIYGYTDNRGKAAFNYKLGKWRALKIKEELLRDGVSAKQIEVFSGGEKNPIAPNDTEEGRKQNRRVEIILVK